MIKKLITPAIAMVGLLFAAISWLYLNQIWEGIKGHTPPCAPIGDTTVPIVFGFIGTGAVVCLVAIIASFRRWKWTAVAMLALVLNLAALSIWQYWIENKMLLPYDKFCEKVGMPYRESSNKALHQPSQKLRLLSAADRLETSHLTAFSLQPSASP